jgi:hypothetical protein
MRLLTLGYTASKVRTIMCEGRDGGHRNAFLKCQFEVGVFVFASCCALKQ